MTLFHLGFAEMNDMNDDKHNHNFQSVIRNILYFCFIFYTYYTKNLK